MEQLTTPKLSLDARAFDSHRCRPKSDPRTIKEKVADGLKSAAGSEGIKALKRRCVGYSDRARVGSTAQANTS